MKYTANYNLKKPDYTDPADITDINNNMDTIDAQLAKIVAQQSRIVPTLVNGYADGSATSLTYWKDSIGYVHFEGKATNSSATSSYVFMLPEGYRPAFEVSFPVYAQGDTSVYRCIIVATGQVYIQTTSGGQNPVGKDIDLSCVIFRAV